MINFSIVTKLSLCIIIFLLGVSPGSEGKKWCYEDPECKEGASHSKWEIGLCRTGSLQSPINIRRKLVEENLLDEIAFTGNRNHYSFSKYTVTNGGESSIQLTFPKNSATFQYAQGPVPTLYWLQEVQFHWGSEDDVGSEHAFDGKSYSMEMHLVHVKMSEPADINEAAVSDDDDGNPLAVIAVMLEVDRNKKESSPLGPIAETLSKVPNPNHKVEVSDAPFLPSEMLFSQTHALVYNGSLTTPACNEKVLWVICSMPVPITESELGAFRNLKFTDSTGYEMSRKVMFRKLQKSKFNTAFPRKVELLRIKDDPNFLRASML